jgi:aminomethyltransferase
MAYVDAPAAKTGATVAVDIRGTAEPAEIVPLPFYQRPKQPTSDL